MCVSDIVRLGRAPHRNAFSPWRTADETAVQHALSLMKLDALAGRSWQRLSGGERQRCQIARARSSRIFCCWMSRLTIWIFSFSSS